MNYYNLMCLALAAVGTSATPVKPSTTHTKRQNPSDKGSVENPVILNYSCRGSHLGDMPEICNNMCYGVNCLGFPSTMWYDRQAKTDTPQGRKESRARTTAAGCKTPNRCSDTNGEYKGMKYQCDEFPFKSVWPDDSTTARGGPINRCVPTEQNNAQGSMLNNFYYSHSPDFKPGDNGGLKGDNGRNLEWFKIAFSNAGGIQYCAPAASRDCTNDGNEMRKPKGQTKNELAYSTAVTLDLPPAATADASVMPRDDGFDAPHQYFVTKHGHHLFIPGGADIGDAVYSLPTLDKRSNDSDPDDFEFETDEIVGLANATDPFQ